jgi:nitrite reductase/ring-hydroxylating ferredoxin subunit/uncharacterized membrane protein
MAKRDEPGSKKTIVGLVDRQEWLDGVADALVPGITNLFRAGGAAGQRVKDLLNGVWLGHPLHPVLTDVPIGAWTAAILFDAMEAGSVRGNRGLARAADAAVALGLAGSFGAAVTGLTDWSDTYGRARRVGAAHALMNATAAVLFTTSLVCRRREDRRAGRLLALLGYGVSAGAAYLGGHLVFGEKVGVDHAPGEELPTKFVSVLAEKELPEKKLKRVQAGKVPVLLYRRGKQVFAIAETCAHMGGPLSEGKVQGEDVICPWHGSRFSLRTGEVRNGPSTFSQPCFETRVVDGRIEVAAKGER